MRIDISNRIGTTSNQGGFKGLLDVYSGAAAAYSLRKLSKATTSVVRVRRDSDNAEADFTALEITDGTLAAFCTGTDGLVTTWYDQSGNGNDATQGSAASQPKIVSAGVLVTENGRPAIDFDNSNDFLRTSSFSVTQPNTWFSVVGIPSILPQNVIAGGIDSSNRQVPYAIAANSDYMFAGANLFGNAATLGQKLFTSLFDGASSNLHNNGVLSASGNAGAKFLAGITIGARYANDEVWHGTIQEIVLYPTDQSTNRSGIESRINNYYNIY